MSLKDLIASDAKDVFIKESDFAELIKYRTAAGAVSNIIANVYRNSLEVQGEDRGRSLASPIEIHVARADVASVTIPGDAVELKRNLSDSAAIWIPVTSILEQDEGLWKLAIGR